jgi:hypothetical protein
MKPKQPKPRSIRNIIVNDAEYNDFVRHLPEMDQIYSQDFLPEIWKKYRPQSDSLSEYDDRIKEAGALYRTHKANLENYLYRASNLDHIKRISEKIDELTNLLKNIDPEFADFFWSALDNRLIPSQNPFDLHPGANIPFIDWVENTPNGGRGPFGQIIRRVECSDGGYLPIYPNRENILNSIEILGNLSKYNSTRFPKNNGGKPSIPGLEIWVRNITNIFLKATGRKITRNQKNSPALVFCEKLMKPLDASITTTNIESALKSVIAGAKSIRKNLPKPSPSNPG